MSNDSSRLLTSISERGRSLLRRGGRIANAAPMDANGVVALCEGLLSGRGEAPERCSPASARCLPHAGRGRPRRFFRSARARLRPRPRQGEEASPSGAAASAAPAAACTSPPSRAGRSCSAASTARRARPGTGRDARGPPGAQRRTQGPRHVDRDLVHLFASWFNRGFLVVRRIELVEPANILEKVIRYEAVHEIHDWDDLRRRHRSGGPALLRLLPPGAAGTNR